MTDAALRYIVEANDRDLRELQRSVRDTNRSLALSEHAGTSAGRGMTALGRAGGVAMGSLRRIGGAALFAAKGLGLAAGIGFAATLKIGISEMSQHAKVAAQTANVLKSTGGAAGVSAKHVDSLASALMRKTGVDDEAIQSGENLLLTFTGIKNQAGKGNDVFDQATRTVLDMSRAFGTDASKSAIQLGKALNDPVKGISALSRVGVSFTAQQKEQIKALVASGHTLEAQKIILGELKREVGGSAEAYGRTLPGKLAIAKESFSNLAGEVATGLLPILTRALDWVNAHWDQISAVFRAVATGIGYAINNIIVPAIKAIIVAGEYVVNWIKDHWPEISSATMTAFNTVKSIIETVAAAVQYIWKHYGDLILSQTRAAWEYIKGTIQNALTVIRGIVNVVAGLLHGDFGRVWEGIKQIFGGAIAQLLNMVRFFATTLGNAVQALGRAMLSELTLAWNAIKAIAGRIFGAIAGVVTGGLTAAKDAAVSGATSVMTGMLGGLRTGWNTITGWLGRIPGFFVSFFGGAASWLYDIGTRIIGGLLDGIVHKVGDVKNYLTSLPGKIVSWKGPPAADSILLVDNGRRIMQGLIDGIISKQPEVEGASKQAAQRALAGAQAAEILTAIRAAGQTIGTAHAQAIVMGMLRGETSIVQQAKASLTAAVAAAKQVAVDARAGFAGAFQSLAQQALAAFDAKVATWVPPAQQLLDKMHLEDQVNAATAAITSAQGDLAAAQLQAATATTPEEQAAAATAVETATKALGDAQRAQVELNLQLEAQQQQTAHDARMARDREHLAGQLAQLQRELAKHPEAWRTAHGRILTILKGYDVPMFTAGQRLASQFADGLTKGIAEVVRAARALATALEGVSGTPPHTTTVAAAHRALGGDVAPGVPYTVGEHGRELFVPTTAGRIIPNRTTRQLERDTAGGTTVQLAPGGTVVIREDADIDRIAAALSVEHWIRR